MTPLKYKKHILTELKLPEEMQNREPAYNKWAKHLLWLDKRLIQGAPLVNTAWYFQAEPADMLAALATHTHDFDEVVGFFGSDSQDPYELGGTIEFLLEDEKYTIKNSCLIFIQKGMKHSGAIMKVDKPIFHISLGNTARYVKIMS